MVQRFDAKIAYGLGGLFRERINACEECKCIEFNIVGHPKTEGLIVMECTGCSKVYVTIDRRKLYGTANE